MNAQRIEFPEVMGITQAAAYLDISPDTLYVYVKRGTLPTFKLGNRWKFRKVRLDEWMDERAEDERAARREEPAPKKLSNFMGIGGDQSVNARGRG